MNNRIKSGSIVVAAILMSLFSGALHAQNEKEKPSAPYVLPIPDYFQWTISIEKSPASPDGPAGSDGQRPKVSKTLAVQKVVCTKTKDVKRDIVIYNNGNSSEVWYYRGRVIIREPGGGFAIERAGSRGASLLVPDLSREGFVSVGWVAIENFQTKKKLENGREAWVYSSFSKPTALPTSPSSPSMSRNEDADTSAPSIPCEAMIDVDSHLPLVVQQGTRRLVYSYQTPPVQMLALPADFQTELSAMDARIDVMTKLRSIQRH